MSVECTDSNLYITKKPFTDSLYLYDGDVNYQNKFMFDKYEPDKDLCKHAQEGVISSSDSLQIQSFQKYETTVNFDFTNSSASDVEVKLPLYGYIELYSVKCDGQSLQTGIDQTTHMMTVLIPSDMSSGTVNVRYRQPIGYIVCNISSLLSVIGLIVLWSKQKKGELKSL